VPETSPGQFLAIGSGVAIVIGGIGISATAAVGSPPNRFWLGVGLSITIFGLILLVASLGHRFNEPFRLWWDNSIEAYVSPRSIARRLFNDEWKEQEVQRHLRNIRREEAAKTEADVWRFEEANGSVWEYPAVISLAPADKLAARRRSPDLWDSFIRETSRRWNVPVHHILWLSNGKPITIYDIRSMNAAEFNHFAATEPQAFERYCKLDIENCLRRVASGDY
jgi:hypothetical protein